MAELSSEQKRAIDKRGGIQQLRRVVQTKRAVGSGPLEDDPQTQSETAVNTSLVDQIHELQKKIGTHKGRHEEMARLDVLRQQLVAENNEMLSNIQKRLMNQGIFGNPPTVAGTGKLAGYGAQTGHEENYEERRQIAIRARKYTKIP